MKIQIRDVNGTVIGAGDVTWVIDPQINADLIDAYQQYSFPLTDCHGALLGQVEIIP